MVLSPVPSWTAGTVPAACSASCCSSRARWCRAASDCAANSATAASWAPQSMDASSRPTAASDSAASAASGSVFPAFRRSGYPALETAGVPELWLWVLGNVAPVVAVKTAHLQSLKTRHVFRPSPSLWSPNCGGRLRRQNRCVPFRIPDKTKISPAIFDDRKSVGLNRCSGLSADDLVQGRLRPLTAGSRGHTFVVQDAGDVGK